MRTVFLAFVILGVPFGWVWRGGRYAWLDLLSARNRIRGARRVFRRETLYSAVTLVVAFLVVRALLI